MAQANFRASQAMLTNLATNQMAANQASLASQAALANQTALASQTAMINQVALAQATTTVGITNAGDTQGIWQRDNKGCSVICAILLSLF